VGDVRGVRHEPAAGGGSPPVLAIDPGRAKCGVAVGRRGAILARAVVPMDVLVHTVRVWVEAFGVGEVLLGAGTGHDRVRALLAAVPDLPPVRTVAERGSTLEARRRYFAEHPPRGWRRLLPPSLQVPPEAYDDYAAVVLIERVTEGG
jgi:RNase H-fold protein (predicted Holliday junction resolvase)